MGNLKKIQEVSSKYNITSRTLRYYEDEGLIPSTRTVDYAYRMYDEAALKRLEKVLSLRNLELSIKEIQQVLSSSDSDVMLQVLQQKVERIDSQIVRLKRLKTVIADFIQETAQPRNS